jgi:hypothetical protein
MLQIHLSPTPIRILVGCNLHIGNFTVTESVVTGISNDGVLKPSNLGFNEICKIKAWNSYEKKNTNDV